MQKIAIIVTALTAVVTARSFVKRDDHNGVATYFYQNGNAGSCGNYNPDSAYIVAMSTNDYPYNSQCGNTVTITNTGGGDDNNGVGTTITATVADTCLQDDGSACQSGQLDLSTGAFQALTGGNLDPPGEFNIDWTIQPY